MIKIYFLDNNYAILLRKHGFVGNSVWEEYNESMLQLRYRKQRDQYLEYIKKYLDSGLSDKVKVHSACGFLIRNMKHEKINEINNKWYEHIQECGIQDQISFFFVKQFFDENFILSFAEYPYLA
jgi:hypothetical protein